MKRITIENQKDFNEKIAGRKPRACALKHPVRFGNRTIHLTDEGLEQFIVCRWLETNSVFFCAVPNGGKATAFNRLMAAALGEKRGVSDLLIFDTPPKYSGVKGVAVEMKSIQGKPSSAQEHWQEEIGQRGWMKAICHGADDAINFLKGCGYGR